ncbi:hypothetical protein ABW19_dt0205167 [Dactylella cylindrospora]|nr:hypothetical protein ABW19_dt0205167 [Dactylella cylindrospora]
MRGKNLTFLCCWKNLIRFCCAVCMQQGSRERKEKKVLPCCVWVRFASTVLAGTSWAQVLAVREETRKETEKVFFFLRHHFNHPSPLVTLPIRFSSCQNVLFGFLVEIRLPHQSGVRSLAWRRMLPSKNAECRLIEK